MPVVKNAASNMCGQRTIMTGPVTIAHQSDGMILPSTIVCPTGTCIQLLLARIQNEENIVPSETMQQAKKKKRGDTRLRPSSMTPKKLASSMKAVNDSYPSSGPWIEPVFSTSTPQLVPNWNAITTPVTTPMPNDSAKIFSQKSKTRR